MKKYALLLALALAASAVSAQPAPQVSVYGKVRAYQESYTLGTASEMSRLTNDYSRIGFKATADAGNGITATAVVETTVAADAPSATSLGDRNATLSLGNSLGSVAIGRAEHSVSLALDNFDAMGNVYGSTITGVHAAYGSRLQNAVFVSTAPVAGFKANYVISNSETAGVTNVQTASIDYAAGPFAASLARYTDGGDNQNAIVGASYTVAKTGTKVFGMYSDDKVAGVNSTGKSVGVRQDVTSQLALLGSYGESNAGTTAKAMGVAYTMSKSVTLHARWLKTDAPGADADVTRYGVGAEFSF